MKDTRAAFEELKRHRDKLTRQQTRTIAGQIKAGDVAAAMAGLARTLARKGDNGVVKCHELSKMKI